MEIKNFIIFCAVTICLAASVSSLGLVVEDPPINYSNIIINETSNMTNLWDTNEGILDNVEDIEHNQLSNLLWSVAGHIMDTFLDMKGNYITNVSSIQFDPTGDGCEDEFCLEVNAEDGALELTLPGGGIHQIGNQLPSRFKANETISKGDVIYPCGGSGNRFLACKADYGNIATAGVTGIALEDIAENQFGYVNHFGQVKNINTTGALGYCSDGSPAWLSSNGLFQCIPPSGDKIKTIVGVIVSTHETTGIIYTTIQ